MQHFQFEDLTIAYERAGTGTAVLFLHNGGTSHCIWRHQMSAFAADHDVIAVDLPGFGESPLAKAPLTLDRYIEATVALITGLDLAPVVIVGNCMGSNIALGVSESAPELVTALVLVNPLTEATFSAGWLGLLHKLEKASPPISRALRFGLRRVPVPRPAAKLAVRFQTGSVGARRQLHKDPDLIACNLRRDQLPALIDVLDDMAAYGAMDRARIPDGIPVLALWGEQNRVLSHDEGVDLNQRLDIRDSHDFGGCGHLPMLESPEAVTSAITDFLSSLVDTPIDTHEAVDITDHGSTLSGEGVFHIGGGES